MASPQDLFQSLQKLCLRESPEAALGEGSLLRHAFGISEPGEYRVQAWLQLLPEYQRQVLKWEVDTVNTTTYSRSAQEVMINLCGDLEFMTRALQERDEQLAEQERRIEKMEELAIIDMARLRAANEQIDELEAEVGELMGKLYEDDGSDGPEVYSDAVEEMKEESEELDQHEVRDKSEAGSEDSEQLKKLGEELEEVLRMAKKATLEEAAKK